MKTILPQAMLGILGGGQLGRLFTIKAKQMGYKVTVLDPDPFAPAADFADIHVCAAFDDEKALVQLANTCEAITTEFENVSATAMTFLAQHTRVSPSGNCVAIAQDRVLEKNWINQAKLPTAPYAVIATEADLIQESISACLPGILKTARLGYDGKGQVSVYSQEDLHKAWLSLGSTICVLEKRLELELEVSALVARTDSTRVEVFPLSENVHVNGILDESIVPARIDADLTLQIQKMAIQLADTLDYVGVLAVEFFILEGNHIVVNEIAPRPHNSGHYTLEACVTDQFSQQVKTMCNLTPGSTRLLSSCVMVNLLGDVWPKTGDPNWQGIMNSSKTFLHLYGKKEARKGRKMGHFTVLNNSLDLALSEARDLKLTLS